MIYYKEVQLSMAKVVRVKNLKKLKCRRKS